MAKKVVVKKETKVKKSPVVSLAKTKKEPIPLRIPEELKRFNKINPESKIRPLVSGWLITKPWGDESIIFYIKETNTNALSSFSSVRMPPRFSAIWHNESNDMEFIYCFLPPDSYLLERKFHLKYKGKEYLCEYVKASEKLQHFADCFRVGGISETSYRNLTVIKYEKKDDHDIPVSFWIRGLDIDEVSLVDLAYHLNFYMVFYDSDSPTILVHQLPIPEQSPLPKPSIQFPEIIPIYHVEPYLLSLWQSARDSSDFQRFIHYYQILEYAAFYYIKEDIYGNLKKILLNANADIRKSCEQILEMTTSENSSDETKIKTIVKDNTDIELLWEVVDSNRDALSQKTKFEGGVTIDELITDKTTFSEFKVSCHPKLAESFKDIRNALVHSREKRQSHTIHPSFDNVQKLRPWVELLNVVSNHVILFNRK